MISDQLAKRRDRPPPRTNGRASSDVPWWVDCVMRGGGESISEGGKVHINYRLVHLSSLLFSFPTHFLSFFDIFLTSPSSSSRRTAKIPSVIASELIPFYLSIDNGRGTAFTPVSQKPTNRGQLISPLEQSANLVRTVSVSGPSPRTSRRIRPPARSTSTSSLATAG